MSDMVVNEIHAVMVTVLGRAHRKKEEGRTFLSLRLMIKPVRFISIDICFVMALWNVCRLQQLIQQQNVGKLFKFILKKNSKHRDTSQISWDLKCLKKIQLSAELEMTKNVRKKIHRAAYCECMKCKSTSLNQIHQEMFGILYYFNPRVSDNSPILIYCVHQISAWS